ncbi:hypothetical protein [Lysobacter gummosus]|uniref:hypothetical protein n=1 Tax=Lysobacter gummosus TaxID=262324 RepID=UPI003627DC1C
MPATHACASYHARVLRIVDASGLRKTQAGRREEKRKAPSQPCRRSVSAHHCRSHW